jgi:hypothetical protein
MVVGVLQFPLLAISRFSTSTINCDLTLAETDTCYSAMSRSASSQHDVVDGPSDSLADREMTAGDSLARSPSRVKRLSTAIDNAVDRLGRSLNHSKSSPPQTPSSPSSSSHKRIFSLSRRTKASDSVDGYEGEFSTLPLITFLYGSNLLECY